MFCTNCGAQVPDDAGFCTNCGAALSPVSAEGAADATARMPAAAPASPQAAPTPDQAAPGAPSPAPRRPRTALVAGIACLVVLAVAGGLTAYHVLGPGLPLPWLASEDAAGEDAEAEGADAAETDAEEESTADEAEDAGDDQSPDADDGAATGEDGRSSGEVMEPTDGASAGGVAGGANAGMGGDEYQGMDAVASMSCSSVLAGDEVTSYYGTANLTDGDLSTGWAEGVDGTGVGQWFQLDLATPQTVNRLNICPGYAKSQKLFRENGCPTRVRVHYSDGTYTELELRDQLVEGSEIQSFSTEEPHTTTYLRVEIVEVRPGTVYDDTVISEFSFQ